MNRALKWTLIPALVVGLLLGLRLFHLGPFGIHPGDDVVLARFALTNGTRLCVIAHRTENIGEPYEVTLYRTEITGLVFTYWMGYEDSFWWGCSITHADSPSVLHINVYGSKAAVYNVQDETLSFLNDHYHYGVQTGRLAKIEEVPSAISRKF